MRYVVSLLLCLILAMTLFATPVSSDELDDINREIGELTKALTMSISATRPLESQLVSLQRQLSEVKQRVEAIEEELAVKRREIGKGYERLEKQRALLNKTIRDFYMKSYYNFPLLFVLSKEGGADVTRVLAYQRARADEDKRVITNIALLLSDLEARKKSLESEEARLASAKVRLNEQATELNKIVSGAKAYQQELSGKIAALTARQQAILSEKSATFQTTVGDVPLADDAAARPDFNPGFSPAFAAFSFGAPHFKGMSQYGAFGRAKSGQNYRQILESYYGSVEVRKVAMPAEITTAAGRMPFEGRYLRGIAEMPSLWADQGGYEALKAQAVAARSYALAYVSWRIGNQNASGTICVTEDCQVYHSGKADNPGRWGDAVRDTEGEILVGRSSNEIVNSWYASTSGGYQESYTSLSHTTPAFWDTPSGRSGWTSQAYEKVSSSPWFYKGWYRSRSGDACGRSHPWLTGEELADVLNAWVVLIKHGQADDRVTPTGSCWGGNPYGIAELRGRAKELSVGYSTVHQVSVSYNDSGVTANVAFQTDQGSVNLPGRDFYKAFNLRAAGRISLKSGLFNIEKK